MQPVAPGQTALSKCLVWRPRPTIFGISVYPGTPVDSSAWITSSSSSFGYRSMYISRRSRSPPPRTAVSASTRVIRLPFVPRVLGGRQLSAPYREGCGGRLRLHLDQVPASFFYQPPH